jgi:hypothetical protein
MSRVGSNVGVLLVYSDAKFQPIRWRACRWVIGSSRFTGPCTYTWTYKHAHVHKHALLSSHSLAFFRERWLLLLFRSLSISLTLHSTPLGQRRGSLLCPLLPSRSPLERCGWSRTPVIGRSTSSIGCPASSSIRRPVSTFVQGCSLGWFSPFSRGGLALRLLIPRAAPGTSDLMQRCFARQDEWGQLGELLSRSPSRRGR